jgi:hypothetical protein
MKLLEEGDLVEVTASKSGYRGPGQLIGIAYGTHWLVKVPRDDGRNTVITVNAMHLNKTSSASVKDPKKKNPHYDPKEAFDETEEMLPQKRGKGRRG